MAVTALPPNANWTSGKLTKRRRKPVRSSKTNPEEGWHKQAVCQIRAGLAHGVVGAAGPQADYVSLPQHQPCTVPSPFPCFHGGRAAWPSSTELGAVLHSRCYPNHPFFPFSRPRQQHTNGTIALVKPSGCSFSAPCEEASNATTDQHHSLLALLT